jgi:hypothetical protein
MADRSVPPGPPRVARVLPVAVVAALYFGLNANEVAWATERFQTYAELRRSMFRWNVAAALAICLAIIVILKD